MATLSSRVVGSAPALAGAKRVPVRALTVRATAQPGASKAAKAASAQGAAARAATVAKVRSAAPLARRTHWPAATARALGAVPLVATRRRRRAHGCPGSGNGSVETCAGAAQAAQARAALGRQPRADAGCAGPV